jgi:hypothetical protein
MRLGGIGQSGAGALQIFGTAHDLRLCVRHAPQRDEVSDFRRLQPICLDVAPLLVVGRLPAPCSFSCSYTTAR